MVGWMYLGGGCMHSSGAGRHRPGSGGSGNEGPPRVTISCRRGHCSRYGIRSSSLERIAPGAGAKWPHMQRKDREGVDVGAAARMGSTRLYPPTPGWGGRVGGGHKGVAGGGRACPCVFDFFWWLKAGLGLVRGLGLGGTLRCTMPSKWLMAWKTCLPKGRWGRRLSLSSVGGQWLLGGG